jgi:hypothetical protein
LKRDYYLRNYCLLSNASISRARLLRHSCFEDQVLDALVDQRFVERATCNINICEQQLYLLFKASRIHSDGLIMIFDDRFTREKSKALRIDFWTSEENVL